MEIISLVLEVTRRCNMQCGHCLRGDAQNLDMSDEIIDRLLNMTDVIGEVTFTGGEPSLNVHAIRYFFERAQQLGKMPLSFYVVTNGRANQLELAVELLKAYALMEESEYCGVALSVDEWHDATDGSDIVRGLAFYRADKEYNSSQSLTPIKEGRAASLQTAREPRLNDKIVVNGDVIETLYVAANGNLIGDCDFSYDHIDQLSMMNLYDINSLEECEILYSEAV